MVKRYSVYEDHVHHDIEDGEYVRYDDYSSLEARVAELERDSARLDAIAEEFVIEGFVGVKRDVYDIAFDLAGDDEPTREHERKALRVLMDEYMERRNDQG